MTIMEGKAARAEALVFFFFDSVLMVISGGCGLWTVSFLSCYPHSKSSASWQARAMCIPKQTP